MSARAALGEVALDPLLYPTDENPRWRLRVFDNCWPWRATRREALRDAIMSRNARRCPDDRLIYLDAAAAIQRDPPHRYDQWKARSKRSHQFIE
ncbi:hypothetical protein [Sphingomonas sp. SORGH_AS_0879]|uniref:hypothetical protein n=1 Tax=Sphingomonas sp. SORGH_AS_0879 TaxID=3041790 RepID=UPI00277F578C|nr:hypothetical protein [Sphingomonas sp. SORGH_AS_0879]MDQ1229284.1 hypothetical protein [Sphingomonas sp. SORGH_AS_0879]